MSFSADSFLPIASVYPVWPDPCTVLGSLCLFFHRQASVLPKSTMKILSVSDVK